MKRYANVLLVVGLIMVLTVGCGGGNGGNTAQTMLDNSTAYMSGLDGYQFQLSHAGPTVYVDAEGTIELIDASGHYVSPDQVDTSIKISAFGFITEISVISIGDEQWGSNPLTGAYQPLDETYSFKPTKLFDPESGFFSVLQNNLSDVTLVGDEELEEMPGLPLQHLTGTLAGDVVLDVSYGLIDELDITVDIWLDGDSGEMHRVSLSEPLAAEGEEASAWQIDFWGFGETIEIVAP